MTKKEGIPEGCVPTSQVVFTPGGMVYSRIPYSLDTLPPGRYMEPDIPYPQKGIGTRDTLHPERNWYQGQ